MSGGSGRSGRAPAGKVVLKGSWKPEEDAVLKRLVDANGAKNWTIIAEQFNQEMGRAATAGRTGKQCRERWIHHLRPDIKTGVWTEEEDLIIVDAHKQYGNRWRDIARLLPGRTETAVKNHWNSTLRQKTHRDKGKLSALKCYIMSLDMKPSGNRQVGGGNGGWVVSPGSSGSGGGGGGHRRQGRSQPSTARSQPATARSNAGGGRFGGRKRSRHDDTDEEEEEYEEEEEEEYEEEHDEMEGEVLQTDADLLASLAHAPSMASEAADLASSGLLNMALAAAANGHMAAGLLPGARLSGIGQLSTHLQAMNGIKRARVRPQRGGRSSGGSADDEEMIEQSTTLCSREVLEMQEDADMLDPVHANAASAAYQNLLMQAYMSQQSFALAASAAAAGPLPVAPLMEADPAVLAAMLGADAQALLGTLQMQQQMQQQMQRQNSSTPAAPEAQQGVQQGNNEAGQGQPAGETNTAMDAGAAAAEAAAAAVDAARAAGADTAAAAPMHVQPVKVKTSPEDAQDNEGHVSTPTAANRTPKAQGAAAGGSESAAADEDKSRNQTPLPPHFYPHHPFLHPQGQYQGDSPRGPAMLPLGGMPFLLAPPGANGGTHLGMLMDGSPHAAANPLAWLPVVAGSPLMGAGELPPGMLPASDAAAAGAGAHQLLPLMSPLGLMVLKQQAGTGENFLDMLPPIGVHGPTTMRGLQQGRLQPASARPADSSSKAQAWPSSSAPGSLGRKPGKGSLSRCNSGALRPSPGTQKRMNRPARNENFKYDDNSDDEDYDGGDDADEDEDGLEDERGGRQATSSSKRNWSQEESDYLQHLVRRYGQGKWCWVARDLNLKFYGSNKTNNRTSKQCRERWLHHLQPDISKKAWSEAEERILVAAHKRLGNRWSDIARQLPGRSENAVKNHWNTALRRKFPFKYEDMRISILDKYQSRHGFKRFSKEALANVTLSDESDTADFSDGGGDGRGDRRRDGRGDVRGDARGDARGPPPPRPHGQRYEEDENEDELMDAANALHELSAGPAHSSQLQHQNSDAACVDMGINGGPNNSSGSGGEQTNGAGGEAHHNNSNGRANPDTLGVTSAHTAAPAPAALALGGSPLGRRSIGHAGADNASRALGGLPGKVATPPRPSPLGAGASPFRYDTTPRRLESDAASAGIDAIMAAAQEEGQDEAGGAEMPQQVSGAAAAAAWTAALVPSGTPHDLTCNIPGPGSSHHGECTGECEATAAPEAARQPQHARGGLYPQLMSNSLHESASIATPV